MVRHGLEADAAKQKKYKIFHTFVHGTQAFQKTLVFSAEKRSLDVPSLLLFLKSMRSTVHLVANSHGLGRRELGHHWQTSLIDGDMMFATELSPIRAIGLGLIPTGGGERWPSQCWRVLIRSSHIQCLKISHLIHNFYKISSPLRHWVRHLFTRNKYIVKTVRWC